MELMIWFMFEIIFFSVHLFMSLIPVTDTIWSMSLAMYSQVFINILAAFIFRKYLRKANRVQLLGRKNLKYYIWAVVIGVGICLGHRIFFLFFIDSVTQSLQEIGAATLMDQAIFMTTVPGILYSALLGPVTEEVFFRGIIFHVARQRRGNLYAVIVSSFLFAIGHLNGIQFLNAMFMGVIIGYAIILTDNVYIGIIIHTANNAFSLFNSNFALE